MLIVAILGNAIVIWIIIGKIFSLFLLNLAILEFSLENVECELNKITSSFFRLISNLFLDNKIMYFNNFKNRLDKKAKYYIRRMFEEKS